MIARVVGGRLGLGDRKGCPDTGNRCGGLKYWESIVLFRNGDKPSSTANGLPPWITEGLVPGQTVRF